MSTNKTTLLLLTAISAALLIADCVATPSPAVTPSPTQTLPTLSGPQDLEPGLQTPAAGRVKIYIPEATRTPDPSYNLVVDNIQLITPEETIGANVNADELGGFVRAAEAKVHEVVAQNTTEFKLLLQFTLYPDKIHEVTIATKGNVDAAVLQRIYDELHTLQPLHTKTDSVVFQLEFTIKVSK